MSLHRLLLVTLLAGCADKAAEVERDARRVVAGDERDATQAVASEGYRVSLAPPAPGWKLLDEAGARAFAGDAILGAVGEAEGKPVAAVVAVRPAEGRSLDELLVLARGSAEGKSQTLQIGGRDARRFEGEGRAGAVVLASGFAFELRLWGAGAAAAAQPFFAAVSFLDGAVKPPPRPAPDASGAHWRVRDGAYESAASGLRVRAPEGFRVVAGAELALRDPQADVALAALDAEAWLRIVSEPGPSRPRRIEEAFGGEAEDAAKLTVLGKELTLARRKKGGDVLAWGELCDATACHLIVAEYRAAASWERLAAAAKGIEALGEADRAALARELAGAGQRSCDLGEGYALRGGVYRSFRHGFELALPDAGWTLAAGAAARRRSALAELSLEERALGLEGAVVVDAEAGGDAAAYHAAVAATYRSHIALGSPKTVGDALVAAGTGDDGLGYRVATQLSLGRGLQLVVWGRPEQVAAQEAAIERLVAALHASNDRAVDTPPGSYLDRRLGVSLAMPAGWRMQVESMPEIGEAGAFVSWEKNRSWVGLLAFCVPDDGAGGGDWLARYLEQLVRERFGPVARAAPTEVSVTLGGISGRRVSWQAPLEHIDALVVSRQHVAYALVTADRDAEAVDAAIKGFSLLE